MGPLLIVDSQSLSVRFLMQHNTCEKYIVVIRNELDFC